MVSIWQHMLSQVIILYTLNLHGAVCQLYMIKLEGKNDVHEFRVNTVKNENFPNVL